MWKMVQTNSDYWAKIYGPLMMNNDSLYDISNYIGDPRIPNNWTPETFETQTFSCFWIFTEFEWDGGHLVCAVQIPGIFVS